MRIRKRYQNPLPPPDLSSFRPPSTATAGVGAAAAVALPVAAAGGATGGKEVEPMAAVAAAARVSGAGCGGGGGEIGLHPNGRTTSLTTCLPFLPPPSAAATAGGAGRGDLPTLMPPLPTRDVLFAHGHDREVPKRVQDGEKENGRDIGDAHRRWNTDAHGGDNACAPKSLGAKPSEVPVGHGGHDVLPRDAAVALAAAEAIVVRWGDEEGEFPPKKRRGGCHAAGGESLALEEEKETNVVAHREMKQPRPSKTGRRRTTDEGGHVMAAAAATGLVDGNSGGGNGKKRRSPAVLMEGSRCSRVNGRGWRCCQQTLVGYSLCEHHLGKGRLRSVSSVRCNGRARKKEDVGDGAALPLPSLLREQDQLVLSGDGEDEEEEEEEKPGKRRRKKIGAVKARSISSLLHQPDHLTPTTMVRSTRGIPISAVPDPSYTRPVTGAAPPPYGTDTACGGVNQCR